MKYGKYDFQKSSADLSVGTSYSWYYRKNDNPSIRKKILARAISDSTLFSDYTNQISMFEKENNKKCKKSVSDVGKNGRIRYKVRNIQPVRMEPFTGNFYYGKPLPGYEDTEKTEEKLIYLPDSDVVTASDDNTLESLTTTAATVVDIPELVKNPLYGCLEADVRILTPEYCTDSEISKDTQLRSSSCTELRRTMCNNKSREELLHTILKDYKKIMKEWNHTIRDHCTNHRSKMSSICGKSNTDTYVKSLHSTLSCRQKSKCPKTWNTKCYIHVQSGMSYGCTHNCKMRKRESLNRNQTFSNWTSTLRNLKKFWNFNHNLVPSESDCLQAIYEDYDRRLRDWCDTISKCSSLLNSVVNL